MTAKITKLPVPKPSAKQQAASAARKPTKPSFADVPGTAPAVKTNRHVADALAEMTEASTYAMPSPPIAPHTAKKIAQAKAAIADLTGSKPKSSLSDMAATLTKQNGDGKHADTSTSSDAGELPEFLKRSTNPSGKADQTHHTVSRETNRETSLTVNPAAKQAQRDEAARAVAENGDKLHKIEPGKTSKTAAQPKPEPTKTTKTHSPAQSKPSQPAKAGKGKRSAGSKPKTATAKKPTSAKPRASGGAKARYDWNGAREAAASGKIPAPPDFSANTHRYYRPALEAVVALVKAKDLAKLKAHRVQGTCSSPKAIKKYQQIAIIALSAK